VAVELAAFLMNMLSLFCFLLCAVLVLPFAEIPLLPSHLYPLISLYTRTLSDFKSGLTPPYLYDLLRTDDYT
jgi:hypothetical protein